ncbi:MAG: heavy metal translocating P-type ATPase, partial [Deltaproteobacteria bacterium]
MARACTHCGLPVPEERAAEAAPPGHAHTETAADAAAEHAFCCTGCEAVWHALHGAGLDAFYRMRELGEVSAAAPAASPEATLSLVDDVAREAMRAARPVDDDILETDLLLDGVHCAGCVWLTERMPHHVPGVADARLDLGRGRLTVRWKPADVDLGRALAWLGRFGYVPRPLRAGRSVERSHAERRLLLRMGLCWALAGNIMILAVAKYAGLNLEHDPALAGFARWVSLLLASLSMVIGGSVFIERAWLSLRTVWSTGWRALFTRLSMDVPIALGIVIGFVGSAAATFQGRGDVWFDSIAVLIAALLTARYLQMRGTRRAAEAAERVLSLLPQKARRVADGPDGETVEDVPADTLVPGDILDIPAGDLIAADGVVLTGLSSVHRAVLTGESRPEPVRPGDVVEAGITNLRSPLRVRVTAAGTDTRVGRLLAWVNDRSERRAPVVQLADRIAGAFVLFVLVAALATGIAWAILDPPMAVAHMVALLVISCPCALGMATPLALTVGVGRAARRGVYVKHDDTLEALARATVVVFDKTGTLTEGRMVVESSAGDADALRAAARLEAHSRHPVALALRTWAGQTTATPEQTPADVREVPGAGLEGTLGGHLYRVGRLAFVAEGAAANHPLRQEAARHAARGMTPVGVSRDGELVAVAAIGDRLRTEAPEVIAHLRERGIRPMLLSGDHRDVVAHVADRLGIAPADATGAASPEEKLARIEALRAEGHTVVMIGDGVNDAAALQAADVGIAVGGGVEASLVAADLFLTRPGVTPVAEALDGARSVMHV